MLDLFGRMMRLPLSAFVFTMERMVKVMDRVDRATGQGWSQVVERLEPRPPPPGSAETGSRSRPALPREVGEEEVDSGAGTTGTATYSKENTRMADTNLNDDMVKLVEYSIVSIERGKERVLADRRQVLETDNLTGDAFSNARIANWVAEHGDDRPSDPDDLRVYYNVLARWPKKDLKFDEKTVKADEDRNKLLREVVGELRNLNRPEA